MESKTKKNINTIGKVGRILSGILAVFMIIAGVFAGAGTVVTASLPKDSLEITVNAEADVKTKGELLTALKDAIVSGNADGTGNIGFGGKDSADEIVGEADSSTSVIVAQSDVVKDAQITDTGDGMRIKLDSTQLDFSLGRMTYTMCVTVANIICIIVMLFMLKKLMKSLEICETPFCDDVIRRMKNFGYSLIPFAVLRTVSESAWNSLLSKDFDISLGVDLTVVMVILVVFLLVMIFTYGAELQKQSDETL